jgi:hypothetical protein
VLLTEQEPFTEEQKEFIKKAKPYLEVGALGFIGLTSGLAGAIHPVLGGLNAGILSGGLTYLSTRDLEAAQWAAAGGFLGGLLGGALGHVVSGPGKGVLSAGVGSGVFSMLGIKLLGPGWLFPPVPAVGVGGAVSNVPSSSPSALPVRWVGQDVEGLLIPDQDDPAFPAKYFYAKSVQADYEGVLPQTVGAFWDSFGDPPRAGDVPTPVGVAQVADLAAEESSLSGDEYRRRVGQLRATYLRVQQTHRQVVELARASAANSRKGQAAIGEVIKSINDAAPRVPPGGMTETEWVLAYTDSALEEGSRALDEALSAQQRLAADIDARTQALAQEREAWRRDALRLRRLGATDRPGVTEAGAVDLFDQPVIALGAGGGDGGGDDRGDLGPAGVDGGREGVQLLVGDVRRGDLRAGLLGSNLGPHRGDTVVRQALPRPPQSPTVGPLRVARASAPMRQIPGDASVRRGERVVAEGDEVAMIPDPWGVGRRADRRSVAAAGSMAT